MIALKFLPAFLLAIFWAHVSFAETTCLLSEAAVGTVVHVIDGQTLRLDDGVDVRLIGALAPDTHSVQGNGPLARYARSARQHLAALVGGKSVQLRTSRRSHDRYRRLLAQAFVRDGENLIWVQQDLVRRGLARAYTLPGQDACLADLLQAERAARRLQQGIWATAAYRVRDASRPWEISRLQGRFAIVSGRVRRAALVRRVLYLNFGRDWKRDFTVKISKAVARRAKRTLADLRSLEGQNVRVRGWVTWRNGPMIEVSSLSEIERTRREKRTKRGKKQDTTRK